MSSIHAEQPEDNRQDLAGDEAVRKIREIVGRSDTCFFCTRVAVGESSGARPMSVREVGDDGSLWFLSAADSHQNAELGKDPSVSLLFQGSDHSGFLQLVGQATVTRDRERIEALWQPILKTWFTEGRDDPRITVVRVRPTSGYYWDNKHGDMIAGIKMLMGAATGTTLDDSVEGTVTP